ncbi:ClpX, ATPase regulatory subunit [Gonapodya prolifera JEL478]|uniref:ClpX, ATPase regulatory subunit n=1 Tax=Gonapodya prolifera (strain JEL478) TaxID=1344416 RepID=A0A139ATK1_GONPJ|nr:ClpX, ATPase regulatory subunit [Gonapodya prolifera JEL478]|eukprot:KXS20052.1 ClpX, ATPase regulatory subunit [Gonapodya prolifera JEL478]
MIGTALARGAPTHLRVGHRVAALSRPFSLSTSATAGCQPPSDGDSQPERSKAPIKVPTPLSCPELDKVPTGSVLDPLPLLPAQPIAAGLFGPVYATGRIDRTSLSRSRSMSSAQAARHVEEEDDTGIPFSGGPDRTSFMSPREIRQHLDSHVVAQDKVKKVLSVAVHNHYTRILSNLGPLDEETLQNPPSSPSMSIFPSVPTSHPSPHSHVASHPAFSFTPVEPGDVDFRNPPTNPTSPTSQPFTQGFRIPIRGAQAPPPRPIGTPQNPPGGSPVHPAGLWSAAYPNDRRGRIVEPDEWNERVALDKSNVLLIGPTGSGKTLLARTVSSLLRVPFSANDATPLTQAGYVGEDVEACVSRLLQAAEYDVARAQRGVIFLDEVDKIAKREGSGLGQRDVSGEGVQQALLRMLEGTIVNVTVKPSARRAAGGGSPSGSGGGQGETYAVDTSNILFICSGAFVGLEKIVAERIGKRGSIGFGAQVVAQDKLLVDHSHPYLQHHRHHSSRGSNFVVDKDGRTEGNILDLVEPDDLIKFGLIPEFVGRLPILAAAHQLSVDDLVRILTEPKSAIVKQYQEIFAKNGVALHFTRPALDHIAHIAHTKQTGARGLRRIMEQLLTEPMYDHFGTSATHVVVDLAAAKGDAPAQVFYAGDEARVEEALRREGGAAGGASGKPKRKLTLKVETRGGESLDLHGVTHGDFRGRLPASGDGNLDGRIM